MRAGTVDIYRCPYSRRRLRLEIAESEGEEVAAGRLVVVEDDRDLAYSVEDGMPRLILAEHEEFGAAEVQERAYYETIASEYDQVMDWLFESFYEDEHVFRSRLIALLELEASSRVLETGAGTCRDSVEIASRLGPEGELFVQDLSANMLAIGRDRMREKRLLDGGHGRINFFIGNAAHLPFANDSFDATYHFGGFNLFTNRKLALAEMARVTRVGGRVVVGDEGMAPWLRGTHYGQILMNSNQLYSHQPPIDLLPECARNASLSWVLGNAFWVIELTVGDGPPDVNLDLPILGRRGGTHRTRYFGRLEGVTPQAKAMAEDAAAKAGVTIHEWLERVVRAASRSGRE
jgi:ubiquinone/menaquinone biosynthesis C-methylase UbiE